MRSQSIIFCFLFLLGSLYSRDTLYINDSFYQSDLNVWLNISPYIDYQESLPDSIGPESVSLLENGWQPLPSDPSLQWRNGSWLRLNVNNDRDQIANLALLIHADEIAIWCVNNDNVIHSSRGGHLVSKAYWDSQQHHPTFDSPHSFQFEIEAYSLLSIYVKLGVNDQGGRLQPKLANRAFFLDHSTHYFNRTIGTQSFFHGVLGIMLLYHFFIFLMYRDLSYLYYSMYILGISIAIFFSFRMDHFTILAYHPRWNRVMLIVGYYLFAFFYTRFLMHFLHQEGWRRDLKLLLQRYEYLILVIGLLSVFLLCLPNSYFRLLHSYWILFPVSLIGLSGLLYISFNYWQSDNGLAKYVAANNFFMLFGLAVITGIYFGYKLKGVSTLEATYWGILFLELMIVLQLLSFALSLSYKGLETERERVRLQELDSLKSRFFASISHEFRTPLALILGPVRELKATINQSSARKRLQLAEAHAQKLLSMVNQILDLAQLDQQKLVLQPQSFDLVGLGKLIAASFESIANEKGIELHFEANKDDYPVYLDKQKMEQILINLVDNAIKYNEAGGQVVIKLRFDKSNHCFISVKDTGIGITKEALPYIFQLYYQGEQKEGISSSGIGLALVKELVELHHGTIEVNSKLGAGTVFRMKIPLPAIRGEHIKTELGRSIIRETVKLDELSNARVGEQAKILLVEDNVEMQSFITSCLQEQYEIVKANNGKQGRSIARKIVPDLIITDVMMPKMDGFTLTKHLKEDEITSHIPIIILTGKASKASKKEGIRILADAYLTKPFDKEELVLQIQALLDNRKKWINYFRQSASSHKEELPIPSIETAFLNKVSSFVKNNLDNEQYSVEQLSRDLRIDRTQLFRKLRAITGKNPSQFIRTYRLQVAYDLLKQRNGTIAEIAFKVGFSTPSYFSRSFKTQFGKTPGEVMNEGKEM